MPSKKHLIAFTFFCLVWVVPMSYSGLLNSDFPVYPRALCYLQKMSRLFTHSIENWQVYYILADHAGSDQWVVLKEDDYFRLKPFGYRTRLHQILTRTKDMQGYERGKEATVARREELIQWIKQRYRELYPYKPQIQRIRIVSAFMPVVDRSLIAGPWQNPPYDFFAEEQKIDLIDRKFYY